MKLLGQKRIPQKMQTIEIDLRGCLEWRFRHCLGGKKIEFFVYVKDVPIEGRASLWIQ